MKTFEVHITGETDKILKEFDALGIKNISVELLGKDRSTLRTEHMSSFTMKAIAYENCKVIVDEIVKQLHANVIRLKIECPVYPEYIERSIYVESHFVDNEKRNFPLSRNVRSGKIMGTDRMYDKNFYDTFIEIWKNEGAEVELCLYDDYIREDFDWFKLYNK